MSLLSYTCFVIIMTTLLIWGCIILFIHIPDDLVCLPHSLEYLFALRSLVWFMFWHLFRKYLGPRPAARFVGVSSSSPKYCRFNSPSQHIPRLWVHSSVRAHTRDNRLMFLSSFSPPRSFPLPLSLKLINISLGK